MLYRLTPTLINEGYVYIAESPLYEITTKDRTYFAYTEPEKATFLEKIGDKKYTIQRSKGLGENDPEMMWLTTMNPREPPPHQGDAHRRGSAPRRCSTSCWADNLARPQGAYRPARRRVSGRSGCELRTDSPQSASQPAPSERGALKPPS